MPSRGRPPSLRGSIRAVKDQHGKIIRYEATINLGKDESGTYRRQVIAGQTKREVQSRLETELDRLTDQTTTRRYIATVAFFDEWLAYVREHKRIGTYHSYETTTRLYIRPQLPTGRLIDLSTQDVRRIIHTVRVAKGPSRTLEYTASVLNRALEKAVEWGYIATNPAKGVLVCEDYAKREVGTLAPDEVQQLLQTAQRGANGEMYVLIYALIFGAGFRRGEALGVGYNDLDPQQKTVQISGSVIWVPHEGSQRHAPKTKKSRRTMWVPEILFDALWAYRQTQPVPTADWNTQQLLFTTRNGTAISPHNVRRHFKELLKEADLPTDTRIHDGRHTCASLLAGEGVNPKVAQEILGHTDIATTLGIYTHVAGAAQRAALDQIAGPLAQVLGSTRTPTSACIAPNEGSDQEAA